MVVVDALILVAIVFGLFLVIPVLYGWARGHGDRRLVGAEQEELENLRELKDSLKDTAYTHMELDSNLATIFIDEIKAFEANNRRRKGLGR